jgi:hypothetical protein
MNVPLGNGKGIALSDATAIKRLLHDETYSAALNAIINDLCGCYSPTAFRGENTHDTAFEMGKRQVALQLIMLRDIDLTPYKKD